MCYPQQIHLIRLNETTDTNMWNQLLLVIRTSISEMHQFYFNA